MDMTEGLGGEDVSDNEELDVKNRNEWTCRLPKEIMHKILSILAHEKQLDSLRNIQSTSSAGYTIVTPYLYRDLHFGVGLEGFGKLLRLFNDVSPSPHLFTRPSVNETVHPLDLGLYRRLRWALSFTKSINLVLGEFEVPPSDTRMYLDICGGLRVLGLPTIWSALDNMSILLGEGDPDYGGYGDVYAYVRLPFGCTLLNLLGQTARLTNLTVDLPNPSGLNIDTELCYVWDYHNTESNLCCMQADHVTVMNLSHASQGVPSARKSLSIGFALRAGSMEIRTPNSDYGWLEARAELLQSTAVIHPSSLMRITVVGIDKGLKLVTVKNVYDSVIKALKSYTGSSHKDFRYRIKPAGSGETGKWDVWHKLDEPFGDQ